MEQAMDKLRDEMAQKSDNGYVQVVGEYVTTYLLTHPAAASAITDEGKTIEGSLQAAKEAAKKKAQNGVAVMPDAEVYAEVLKYYGLAEDENAKPQTSALLVPNLDDIL